MGHNHNHGESHADVWTTVATIGEGTASFLSDAYWVATSIDLVASLEGTILGVSPWGLGFGIAVAIVTAGGAAYSHYALNVNFQEKDHDHEEADHHRRVISVDQLGDDEEPLLERDEPDEAPLTLLQKAALTGDFISHTGDIAGPITFVFDLATHNNAPTWGKALAQCGATLFGAFSSVANVRTCGKSMKELNAKREVERVEEEYSSSEDLRNSPSIV